MSLTICSLYFLLTFLPSSPLLSFSRSSTLVGRRSFSDYPALFPIALQPRDQHRRQQNTSILKTFIACNNPLTCAPEARPDAPPAGNEHVAMRLLNSNDLLGITGGGASSCPVAADTLNTDPATLLHRFLKFVNTYLKTLNGETSGSATFGSSYFSLCTNSPMFFRFPVTPPRVQDQGDVVWQQGAAPLDEETMTVLVVDPAPGDDSPDAVLRRSLFLCCRLTSANPRNGKRSVISRSSRFTVAANQLRDHLNDNQD